MKKRLIGIDVIRILCAILILFFHLGGRGIEFKGWNEWIGNQVEFIMILFFMISGFCLSFSKRNLSGKNEILDFYKRRILKLLPLYLVIEIYLLIISIYYGSEWINRIKIFPIRLLGLQMAYPVEVYVGVDWFIGSIMMCYLMYPIIQILTDKLSNEKRYMVCIGGIVVLFYSMLMKEWFPGTDLYYNTFFRFLEFSIGAVIPHNVEIMKEKNKYVKNIVNWLGLIALLGVISHRNDNWIWLFVQLLFLPIIISVASNVYLPRYLEKMIMILSGCTFEIFIFQDVIFSDPFINKVRMIEGNGSKFYYFIICMLILCMGWKGFSQIISKIYIRKKGKI